MSDPNETGLQVLALCMPDNNDAEADTIRDYLAALLRTLWEEGEGFSGKRPFGNSGWQTDVHIPLIQAGFISGTVDEDGFSEDADYAAADRLILLAIDALGDTA